MTETATLIHCNTLPIMKCSFIYDSERFATGGIYLIEETGA